MDSGETGSAVTWKYPPIILKEMTLLVSFIPSLTNYQQADTGTKMIHLGRNTRNTIISKGFLLKIAK